MRTTRRERRPGFAPRVAAAFLAVAGLVAAAACSRSARPEKPVATLPSSPAAAAAFAKIRDEWETRSLERARLTDYLARFPQDGAVPLVKIYLAYLLIQEGNLAAGDAVLASVGTLPTALVPLGMPPGATSDLGTIVRARSLRLHGAPQSALDSLRPLVGKVIDDADREVFLEEIALSAIAAHDDYEALAYLDAWLRGVGEEDKDRVKVKIAQILDTLPRGVLEQTYRTMRERGAASGYAAETQKLVSERLAAIAVESNDAALARWLLDVSGTSATKTGGDAGVELGELAASRRGLSAVAGHTVGLLLPTQTRQLRDEAADVVRGVSWALDLPRKRGDEEGVRLVTRDDGVDEAGTRAALEELAGEGAAIVLAGFDRASADRVSAWAEAEGMPVLLLAAPSPPRMPKNAGFVLGERTERQLAMLTDALGRHGVKTAAFVADTAEDEASGRTVEGRGGIVLLPPARCDVALAEAGKPRFPVEGWLASGAGGWLVSGPTSCARDVLRDVRRATEGKPPPKSPRVFALTLEAGVPPSEVPRGITVLSASAGLVPVVATRPEEAREPDVKAFMERFGVRPSYWTAIGRDAGALARGAIKPLPNDSTSDPRGVMQRRSLVQTGVLAARNKLWTTDDTGVGTDRVLPRALRIVTWQAK